MAKDYSNIGLNTFFQSTTSLGAQESGFVTSMDFDSDFEGILASRLSSESFRTNIDIGDPKSDAFIRLDATNTRIVINDGTDDRIYIGDLS